MPVIGNTSDVQELPWDIVSVCRHLPQPIDPNAGIFVLHRLCALGKLENLQIIQPVPYAPLLRPLPRWARSPSHTAGSMQITHAPMFYLPGVLKSLDSFWLANSIRALVSERRRPGRKLILDAHFGYPDGVACVRIAKELGIPVFVTVRGREIDVVRMPFHSRQLIDALNEATGCISVSRSLLDTLASYGMRRDHAVAIPNAVDRTLFAPGNRQAARAALGIPDDIKVIVSVGNLIALKRHHIVIRAFANLREFAGKALLFIIGGGAYEASYPQQIATLARDCGVQDSVRMVGKVSQFEVARYLQAANGFALGTEREGCCNAVLEALAVGCPVVTTPVGDNAYYVTPPSNGFLVPVDDVTAMTEALLQVLSRDWDPHQISTNLDVGDWTEAATRVQHFMRSRMQLQRDQFKSWS